MGGGVGAGVSQLAGGCAQTHKAAKDWYLQYGYAHSGCPARVELEGVEHVPHVVEVRVGARQRRIEQADGQAAVRRVLERHPAVPCDDARVEAIVDAQPAHRRDCCALQRDEARLGNTRRNIGGRSRYLTRGSSEGSS